MRKFLKDFILFQVSDAIPIHGVVHETIKFRGTRESNSELGSFIFFF